MGTIITTLRPLGFAVVISVCALFGSITLAMALQLLGVY